MVFRPKTGEYYLAWDNCTYECRLRVSVLSVSKDPFNHDSWEVVGPVIPGCRRLGCSRPCHTGVQTAGVSMLYLDHLPGAKHLAFVSSYNCNTILLAESEGGRDWAVTDPTWMQGREGCWDDCGAIAGGAAGGTQLRTLLHDLQH